MTERDPWMEEVSAALQDQRPGDEGGIHLSAEEIVAYHQKRLPKGRSAQAQEHLVSCSECRGLLLDFENLENLVPSSGVPPEVLEDLAEVQRALQQRLAKEAEEEDEKPLSLPAPSPRPRWSIPASYWVALAALLVLAVGLAFEFRRSLLPREGAAEVFLLNPAAYRGSADAPFRLPAWADSYVLTIGSFGSLKEDKVVAEIRDVPGDLVARRDALFRASDGTFRWSLDRERLAPGVYRLQLLGSLSQEVLDSYEFTLIVESPSD